MRYLDYGNDEVVGLTDIVPLVESLRELPFQVGHCPYDNDSINSTFLQAFCCSIASEDHTSFTPVVCES